MSRRNKILKKRREAIVLRWQKGIFAALGCIIGTVLTLYIFERMVFVILIGCFIWLIVSSHISTKVYFRQTMYDADLKMMNWFTAFFIGFEIGGCIGVLISGFIEKV